MNRQETIKTPGREKKPVNNFVVQKYIFVGVLLFLPLTNWLIFWLGVNISSIKLAFTEYIPGGRSGGFTWKYFEALIEGLSMTEGKNCIGLAISNTMKYFFAGLCIGIPGSLFIAFFLYKKIFMHKFFTIVFYLPAIISSVALVRVFQDFVAENGILSELLHINMPANGLLGSKETATGTIIVYTIWTGFCTNMLLFSGAMSRIPKEVLEAAKLDGIKPLRECLSVIFPMIWPTFSTMLILSATGLFTASGPIMLFDAYNMYGTMTLSYWIFSSVYGIAGMGGNKLADAYNRVSATGLFFTAIGLPIILFVHWLVEKIPDVEY